MCESFDDDEYYEASRRRRATRKTAASGYFVQVKDETNEGYGYWANYYDADGMPLADVESIPTMAQVDSEALAYFGVERTEEWHAARGRGSDWIEAEVRSIGSYADKPYYATRKASRRPTAFRKIAGLLCDDCGWEGDNPDLVGGPEMRSCPRCGSAAVYQEDYLQMAARKRRQAMRRRASRR